MNQNQNNTAKDTEQVKDIPRSRTCPTIPSFPPFPFPPPSLRRSVASSLFPPSCLSHAF